jgi:hypothetical protein
MAGIANWKTLLASWNHYYYYFRSKEKKYLMRRAKLVNCSFIAMTVNCKLMLNAQSTPVFAGHTKIDLLFLSIIMGS